MPSHTFLSYIPEDFGHDLQELCISTLSVFPLFPLEKFFLSSCDGNKGGVWGSFFPGNHLPQRKGIENESFV